MSSLLDTYMKQIYTLLKKVFKSKDLKQMKSVMQSEEMHKLLEAYLQKDAENVLKQFLIDGDDTSDDYYISVLGYILRIANYIYTNSGDNTGLTDSEYDLLMSEYSDLTGEVLPVSETNDTDKVHHKYISLRGTLDKIYKLTDDDVVKNKSQRTLKDWVNSTEKRIKELSDEDVDLWDQNVFVMPKFDGVSCIFECNKKGEVLRALTRGDTERNEAKDIADIVRKNFTPASKNHALVFNNFITKDCISPFGVKTELMMLNEDLDKASEIMNHQFKSTRSAVSSIINSLNPDPRLIDLIHPIQLRYCYQVTDYTDGTAHESDQVLAPMVYDFPYINCKLKEVEKIHEFAFNNKNTYSSNIKGYFRCDGAVIILSDLHLRKILGRENDRNKWEVAFKYTEETAYSKVKDIHFTIGATGKVNVVLEFSPVKMKGNKISRASMGSLEIFNKYHLSKGDTVKIYYDIIPYVVYDDKDPKCKRAKKYKALEVPTVCPDCGEPLTMVDNVLMCTNKNCPSRVKGKIITYLHRMDISYIGEIAVEDFFENKIVTSIEDLYKLRDHQKEILALPGYGLQKFTSMVNDIDAHNKCTISTLLGSIGIDGFGIARFKSLFESVDPHELIEKALTTNLDDFTDYMSGVKGLKEKMISKLYKGIKDNKDTIAFLINVLDVRYDEYKTYKYHVVFTKVRDHELADWINQHEGCVDDNFKKSSTNLVIVPNLYVKSNTVTKAINNGVPLVDIENAKEYITNHFLKK